MSAKFLDALRAVSYFFIHTNQMTNRGKILRLVRLWAENVLLLSSLLALTLLFSQTARADDHLSITLTLGDYPPLAMMSGRPAGLETDIVRESFRLSDVDVDFVEVPNNRAIAGLLKGLYDASYGWAHSPERDAKLLYSSKPIFLLRVVFFQKNNGEIMWNSLQDLGHYRIGVTLGDYYSDEFETLKSSGKLFTDPASSDVDNFKKLLLDRIQLFPMDQDAGQYALKKYFSKEDRQKIIFQRKALSVVPVYLVIRRDLGQAKELRDRFDRGFQQLIDSGRYQKMVDMYRANLVVQP